MNIGENFKYIRKEKNISQMQIAKETGISQKAISFYEKAAKMEDNIVTTPYALFKAAFAYQMEGNNEAAAKLYKEIDS